MNIAQGGSLVGGRMAAWLCGRSQLPGGVGEGVVGGCDNR